MFVIRYLLAGLDTPALVCSYVRSFVRTHKFPNPSLLQRLGNVYEDAVVGYVGVGCGNRASNHNTYNLSGLLAGQDPYSRGSDQQVSNINIDRVGSARVRRCSNSHESGRGRSRVRLARPDPIRES